MISGHLEHALKLEEFYDLREVPAYPQSLCPSKNASWSLVQEMIDQVVSLHPTARWLHIGCDEVYQVCSLTPLLISLWLSINDGTVPE